MKNLEPEDWNELRALAKAAGFSEDRVIVAQSRFQADSHPFNGPATLLFGRSDGGIDWLVSRWLGREVWSAHEKLDSQPVVMGRNPSAAVPQGVNWPTVDSSKMDGGFVFVLRADKISDSLCSTFDGIGGFDQAIFVTRWTQPMTEAERELIIDASKVVQNLSSVIVALPSEDTSEDNSVLIREFIGRHICLSGFEPDHLLGIHILTVGASPEQGKDDVVARMEELLRVAPSTIASARAGHQSRILSDLIGRILDRAKSLPMTSAAPLSGDDVRRNRNELDRHMANLFGSTLKASGTFVEANELRSFVVDSVHAWRRDNSLPGIWLKYLEAIRPGSQSALFAAVSAAAELLEFNATPHEKANPSELGSRVARGMPWLIRISMAILAGAIASATFSMVAPAFLQVYSVLPNLVMMSGAILAFCLSSRVTAVAVSPQPLAATPQARSVLDSRIRNWSSFEVRIDSWLQEYLLASPATIAEPCAAFCRRLDISLPASLKVEP